MRDIKHIRFDFEALTSYQPILLVFDSDLLALASINFRSNLVCFSYEILFYATY